jgi:hypothetical protein
MFDYFVLIVSVIGGLITIADTVRKQRKKQPQSLPYLAALIVLTVIATYEATQNKRMRDTRREAQALVKSWPTADRIEMSSRGERVGIILSGMGFLERHKSEMPETYKLAQGMLQTRLKGFENYSTSNPDYTDMRLYADTCVALREFLESAAR